LDASNEVILAEVGEDVSGVAPIDDLDVTPIA